MVDAAKGPVVLRWYRHGMLERFVRETTVTCPNEGVWTEDRSVKEFTP